MSPEVPLRRLKQGWRILHLGQHDDCFGDSLFTTATGDHKRQYEHKIVMGNGVKSPFDIKENGGYLTMLRKHEMSVIGNRRRSS